MKNTSHNMWRIRLVDDRVIEQIAHHNYISEILQPQFDHNQF